MYTRVLAQLVLVGVLVFALGACGTTSQPPPGTVPTSGTLELPPSVQPSAVSIIAGFNEGIVDRSGTGYQVELNQDAVQLVMAVDASGRPLQLAVPAIGVSAAIVNLGAESTAEALIFLSPFVVTTDRANAASTMSMIRALPVFDELVEMIRTQQQAGAFDWADPDEELLTLLARAFEQLQTAAATTSQGGSGGWLTSAQGFHPDFAVNGLEMIDWQQGPAASTFAIRNWAKRYIAVYIDPSEDGVSFSRPVLPAAFISSPEISAWDLFLDAMQGTDLQPSTTSSTLSLASGVAAYEINAYGLGLAGWRLPESEAYRMLLPSIMTGVFDLVLPTIEVAAGMPLGRELRGRPTEHPFYRFVESMVGRYLTEDRLLIDRGWHLLDAARNGRVDQVALILVGMVITEMANQPRLVADAVNQIILRTGGEAILRRTVDNFLWPIRLVNAVFSVANLTYTLGSIISSETVTTFVVAGDAIDPAPRFLVRGRAVDAERTSQGVPGVMITAVNATGSAVGAARTDLDGTYRLSLPAGAAVLRFTASGYQSVERRIWVRSDSEVHYVGDTALPRFSPQSGSVSGRVLDATNLQSLSGVAVALRSGAGEGLPILAETVTGLDGRYRFDSLAAGAYTATFSMPEYVEDTLFITAVGGQSLDQYDMRLIPELIADQGYRIVLTWGIDPRDLDSHLFTPAIEGTPRHVYFANRGSLTSPPYALLDVDDVTSYGPETITISQTFQGTYSYSVYHYSGAGSLVTSNAHVVLYGRTGLIGSWSVPVEGTGRWWRVFELDGSSGEVRSVNVIGDVGSAGTSSLPFAPTTTKEVPRD